MGTGTSNVLTAIRISLMDDAPRPRFFRGRAASSRGSSVERLRSLDEQTRSSHATRSAKTYRSASEDATARRSDSTQDMQRFAEQCERVRTKMRTTHEESRNTLDAFARFIRSRHQSLGHAYIEYEQKAQRMDLIQKFELEKLIQRHRVACAPDHVLEKFVKAPERSEEERTIILLEEETGENVFRIERALKYFKANDADGSGFLDTDELKDVLCQLHNGIEPSNACMHRAIIELDRDGDGQVSFYEFFTWYFSEFIANKTDNQGKQDIRRINAQQSFSRQQWTPDWLLRSMGKVA
jgi:hypothetical protein